VIVAVAVLIVAAAQAAVEIVAVAAAAQAVEIAVVLAAVEIAAVAAAAPAVEIAAAVAAAAAGANQKLNIYRRRIYLDFENRAPRRNFAAVFGENCGCVS